jgi:transcriptional regulator with XRE-family HTH domain
MQARVARRSAAQVAIRRSAESRRPFHIKYDVNRMDASELVRALRARHALSQTALANRASTTQQAVSRIEHGRVSPTVATLERLAAVCGEVLVLDAIPRDIPFDHRQLAQQAKLPMSERLELALSWNKFAGGIAGKALRALDDR